MEPLDDNFIPTTELQCRITEDPALRQVYSCIMKGLPRDQPMVDQQVQPSCNQKDHLMLAYGLVYWGHGW